MSGKYQLLSCEQSRSSIAEAYRTLRTNLSFVSIDDSCRSILVSSASSKDGKSTNIANLAVVMAQAGKRVLLADCDLRKPVQHIIFQKDNQQGLTTLLTKKDDIKNIIHSGPVENLYLLCSGPIPPNPAEVLNSDQIRELWPRLLQDFDYLLVDSPPILAVADASILATQLDGVILVVNSGKTKINPAREARDQLKKANANLLGVILNQVKTKKRDYHYYHY